MFTGDRGKLPEIDIEGPISGIFDQNCWVFYDGFSAAAKTAAAQGENEKAAAYNFLSQLTSFGERFDAPEAPFVALATFGDRRSAVPEDLSSDDVEALRVLCTRAKSPTLRARLFDILWVLTKDANAGREAIQSYLEAGRHQSTDQGWIYSVSSFKRALQLAAMFGRKKPLFQSATDAVDAAARESSGSKEPYRTLKLARLLFERQIGDPKFYAGLLGEIAADAEAAGDFRRVIAYREHEADWHGARGDKVSAKAAKMTGANVAIKQVEQRASGPGGSAMAASALMTEAIEMLKRAGATKEQRDVARARLAELQQKSLSEMQEISIPFDIKESVEKAQAHVHSASFMEALVLFISAVTLTDPEYVKKEVEEIAKEAPLSSLTAKSRVDEKGRTISVEKGVLGTSGEEQASAMEAAMFAHAASFIWNFRVNGFIEPAREQIMNEHFPTFEDMAFLVRNNPFVPAGHEEIILRGLHAGLHGNFILSSHLLTPQLENSVRYVLESNGVDVSIFKADGTQPVKILGGLLGLPATKKIFGENWVFEMRGCLIEKSGFDFRNRVAHGFVSDSGCRSAGAVLVWWHALRCCLLAHFNTQKLMEKGGAAHRR